MRGLFVTGTDTEVGKTLVTTALMHALRVRGLAVAGMKPVAAGCVETPSGPRNDDAEAIRALTEPPLPYELVNPYPLRAAIAPHIAAAEQGVSLALEPLLAAYARLAAGADVTLVEGAGGWRLPMRPGAFLSELPQRLGLPVLLVVGVRLGCLNHALLTAEAVARDGLPLLGWVANCGFAAERAAEQIEYLQQALPGPLLGILPRLPVADPAAAARHIDAELLLSQLTA